MELLFTIINIISIIILLGIPFGFIRIAKKSKMRFCFGFYFFIMIISVIVSVFGFAFWNDVSNEIILNHYGYDFDAMSDKQRYKNINPENIEKIYQLERNHLGIGWPLKAFLGSLIFLSYSSLVFVIGFLLARRKTKLNS